jgi:hypothetical protein
MLKITEQCGTQPESISLLLEGRLSGPWVEALKIYRTKLPINHRQYRMIDLTGVTFIDAGG